MVPEEAKQKSKVIQDRQTITTIQQEQMTDKKLKQIAHFIRWSLELGILWLLVLPETGFWTSFTLTMLTLGTEWFWINPKDWRES